MPAEIGARIKVDGEAQYNQQISQIIKSQKELKEVMKQTESGFDSGASAQQKAAEKTKILERQLSTAQQKLKAQNDELKRMEEAGEGASAKADTLRLAIARTETEISKLNNELRQNSGMVAFGKDLQAAGDKITGAGDKMTKFGTTMSKSVTAPLAAAGAVAVKLATQFETAMAKLNSIADTSNTSLDELRKQVMDLSNQTGISASEIAEQAYQAISAGQDTGNAVKFVSDTTKLARAGFADTGAALDVLTTILNAYGKKATETAKVSDILVTTQNLGKTTVAQLSENMGQAIPTAAAYSVNLDNIASAYVTLTKQGINTANATTQINGLMNDLGKSGTKASKALKERTGKTFKELMDGGASLADVLKIVKEAADDNGVSLNDMFGNIRAGRAAMAIMNDEGVTFSETMTSMAQAAGATEVAFEKVTNTTAYQFEVALNKVKNTGIEAGQQLLITFAPTLEKIGDAVTRAAKSFSEMSNSEKQALIKTLAFAAGIGPAVTALGGLTKGIGQVTTGAGKLIEKWGMLGKIPTSGIVGIAGAFVGISVALAKASIQAQKYEGEVGNVIRNSEKATDSARELNASIAESAQAYADSSSKLDDNARQANKLVDELEALSNKTNRTAAENQRMVTAVETLNSLYPGLGLTIDANTGKLSQNTKELRNNIQSLADQAKAIAAQERAVEINKQLLDLDSQIAKLEAQKKEAVDASAKAYENYAKSMEYGLTNGEVQYTDSLVAVKDLSTSLEDLKAQQKDLNGELKTAEKYLGEHEDALNATAEATDEASAGAAAFAEEMNSEAQAAEEAAQKIAEGARIQANAFEEVEKAATKSIEDIIKGLRSQVEAQANYRKNLQTLQKYVANDTSGNYDEIVRIIQEGGSAMAGELQGIVDAIEAGNTEALDEMAALANGMEVEVAKTERELVGLGTESGKAMARVRSSITAEKPRIMTEAKAAAQGIGTGYKQGSAASGAMMYTDTATAMNKATKGIKDKAPELKAAGKTAGTDGGKEVANAMKAQGGAMASASGEVIDKGRAAINAKIPSLKAAGTTAGSSGGQAAVDAMRGKRKAAEEAGEYISLGLAKGLNNKARDVNAAAANVASIAIRTMKSVPQISSPSKVTTEYGEFIAEGLIVGMMNKIAAVRAEAAEVARAALPNIGNATMDITGQVGLDPDEMYAAVREGASDATQNIYLNGRDLTRGLKGLGVSFANG